MISKGLPLVERTVARNEAGFKGGGARPAKVLDALAGLVTMVLPESRVLRSQYRHLRSLNTSSLLWGLLFGSIGLGFLVYGRKQRAVVPLVCGLALIVFPYFVSNTIALIAIGIVLMAVPYFLRL